MSYQNFTDDPKTDQIKIKAVHINELKAAINLWSSKYPGTPSVSDPDALMAGEIEKTLANDVIGTLNGIDTLVKTDVTSNCSGAYAASWTTLNTVNSGDQIDASDFNNYIDDMQLLQDIACYNCNTCDSYSPCTCDGTCNGYVAPKCECYTYGKNPCTTCNGHCNGNACPLFGGPCSQGADSGTYLCGGGCQACGNVSGCHKGGACYSGDKVKCTCNTSCYEYTKGHGGCSSGDGFACTKCYAVAYRYPWTES